MFSSRWSRRDVVQLALIGVAELLIFFNNPGHFFMGDTLLWMGYRHRSVAEFIRGFASVDPTLWYRPLAQRTVESVLYPLVGLNPIPYRVVLFVLFFACTIAVFLVTEHLTESRRAAWLAILFYAPHVTHTFTTYDTAFVPELVFTLFFAASVFTWISWLRHRNARARVLSVALFAGSLLSKETAVALPFTLLVVWLWFPSAKRPPLRTLAPHFAVLGIYLAFAIGVLHIRGIDSHQLLERPRVAGQPGYQLVLGENIQDSASQAFSWAFGIPRGLHGQWPMDPGWTVAVLRYLRLVLGVAGFFVLFTPRRRYLLIGVAWFLIAAGPTLPLLNHFVPYYLFAPMVGFAIAVGAILDWAYGYLARLAPALAMASCVIWLTLFAAINVRAAQALSRVHSVLGRSSENARHGMSDVQALYPTLPHGATLLMFDEENPAFFWETAHGMLFQFAYRDDSLRAQYATEGITVSPEDFKAGRAFAFKVSSGHLTDMTSYVKQWPELLLPHRLATYHLEISSAGVLNVAELKDVTVNVLRANNGIIEMPIAVKLDHRGQGVVQSGDYQYVAIRPPGEPNWVTVAGPR